MDDEKLIKCVREYEFLYNALHPKYMDTAKKDLTWKKISHQVKQPAVACKQRWQGLRDSCRRALKKKKEKGEESAKKMKKWRYETEMSFVVPFFSERKTHDSVDATTDDEDPDNDDETREDDSNVSEKIINFDRGVNDTEEYNNRTELEVENAVQYDPQYFQKKARKSEIHTASAVLMTRLLDQPSKEPKLDQLDRFFLSISDTVKKLSPYQQAMAKNQIFSLVSEMELQMLAPSTSSKAPSL